MIKVRVGFACFHGRKVQISILITYLHTSATQTQQVDKVAIALHQSFSTLITRHKSSLKLVDLSVHDILFLSYIRLWPWPLTIWLLTFAVYPNKTLYQTLAKSDNRRRGYCDFSMFNLVAVRHLEFDRKWIFTISRPPRILHNAPACQIST